MAWFDPKAKLVDDVLKLTGRPDRATDRSRKAVELAVLAAYEFGSPVIDSRHLLCGLVREESGVAFHIVNEMGLQSKTIDKMLTALPHSSKELSPELDSDLSLAINDCWEIASSMRHNYIGTEHLLLGIVASLTRANDLLAQLGIDGNTITSKIRSLLDAPRHADKHKFHYPMSVFNFVFRDLTDARHLRISVPESTIIWLSQFSGDVLQYSTIGFNTQEKLLFGQEHRTVFYMLLRILLPANAKGAIDDVERAENLKFEFLEKHQFEDAARWLHEHDSAFAILSQYVNEASTVLPSHIEKLFEMLAASKPSDEN